MLASLCNIAKADEDRTLVCDATSAPFSCDGELRVTAQMTSQDRIMHDASRETVAGAMPGRST